MNVEAVIKTTRVTLQSLTSRFAFLAPALLRLTLGVVFVRTGWGKLQDLERVTGYFTELGIPWPGLNAAVAASTEFFGGLLLLAGLGTRLAALPMAFTMVVAIITAKWSGLEAPIDLLGLEEWSYLVMFLVVAIAGPGALSLDALISSRFDRAARGAGLPRPLPPPGPVAAASR
jgi:putative oxidoreductase